MASSRKATIWAITVEEFLEVDYVEVFKKRRRTLIILRK